MAVYNGGIRFAPDVYYEIKEDGDITVLRNGEEIGGGGNQVMMINITENGLDHTWNQIKNAMNSGQIPIIRELDTSNESYSYYYVTSVSHIPDGDYQVCAASCFGTDIVIGVVYMAANPDDHPIAGE